MKNKQFDSHPPYWHCKPNHAVNFYSSKGMSDYWYDITPIPSSQTYPRKSKIGLEKIHQL